MTIPKGVYGDSLPIGSVGDRQVVAVPATKAASPPIPPDRYCRNGKHPNAALLNRLNEAHNQAILYRSKEVFSGSDRPGLTTAVANSVGAGDRTRYRFAFHTGPYTHSLFVVALQRPPDLNFTTNAYSRIDISTSTTYATTAFSQTLVYGNNPTNHSGNGGTIEYFKVVTNYIDGVAADTDYYGVFTDVDNGRILSASVFDLQSMTENYSGYLSQSTTTHTLILDKDRQDLATISNALWKRGGAQVLNWSVELDGVAKTTASVTLTNIIDTTKTGAPTSSSPGYSLDMTGKARISQTSGVPCIMKAFGKISAGTGGTVYLKDSSNNTVASCTNFTTTAGWISSGAFNLPATTGKYDLQFAVGGGATFTLYAVSIYEYDT